MCGLVLQVVSYCSIEFSVADEQYVNGIIFQYRAHVNETFVSGTKAGSTVDMAFDGHINNTMDSAFLTPVAANQWLCVRFQYKIQLHSIKLWLSEFYGEI